MNFDKRFFKKQEFTKDQIQQYYRNALRDLDIAVRDTFLSVKFNYTYTAFMKAGIALLAFHQVKARSVPGHHVKIIEKTGEILEDEDVLTFGNIMRSKRNMDLYDGGIMVTKKEYKEYYDFTKKVFTKIRKYIKVPELKR